MAIGIFVVPDLKLSQNSATEGTRYPRRTPAPMVRKIQSVRWRSKNERLRETVVTVSSPE